MRIRTVKPSFMRHEELSDLEVANPGQYIMLTFQCLWMLADSKGKFEYKPRTMKLEILPHIPFVLETTLEILEGAGFFHSYIVNGKKYGKIPSFLDHQVLNGKELKSGEKYPEPIGQCQGSDCAGTGTGPGRQEEERELGREEEKEMSCADEVEIDQVSGIDDSVKANLSKKIISDFGFTEMRNPDKLRKASEFVNLICFNGQLEYFSEQYRSYFAYKDAANEQKHHFEKFLDGGWDAANWTAKLDELKKSSHKPGKIAATIINSSQVKNPYREQPSNN